MKSTTTDLRLFSVLDLQTSLLKHQQRLATIYNTSARNKARKTTWERQLNRLQRNKEQDRHMRSQRRLQQINYENSIIHSKLLSEKERKSPFTAASRQSEHQTRNISEWSVGEKRRQRQRIDQQNLKIVHKLVSARGDLLPEKLRQHQQQHSGLLERISKTKKRRQLKQLLLGKYNLDTNGYYLPELSHQRSIRSLNRMRSVSSTRPTKND